jgi:outer membrane protein insertion porin family
VEKGKLQTIDRIEITGNSKTRDKVIRRELRIYEGDLFSGSGLRRSKDRVTALGFFETVEITYKPGRDDTHVVVTVEVKEKSTGSFQVGFGFSSVENFIFTAQVTQNNFLGWGQTVSLSAQLSSLRQLVQLSFYDPYFSTPTGSSPRHLPDPGRPVRLHPSGPRRLGGARLPHLGRRHRQRGVHREWVEASPAEPAPARTPVSSTPTPRRSSAGSAPGPRSPRGALQPGLGPPRQPALRDQGLLPVRLGRVRPDFLGGSLNYARLHALLALLLPLPLGAVLKTNVTLGYIANLDPNRRLPVSELYYLGGINTIRGYTLSSISPTILVPVCNRPTAR